MNQSKEIVGQEKLKLGHASVGKLNQANDGKLSQANDGKLSVGRDGKLNFGMDGSVMVGKRSLGKEIAGRARDLGGSR